MNRRDFIKGCLGGAAAFLIPVPITAASAVPMSFTVSAPWENPVDVILATLEQSGVSDLIDYDSFAPAREYCEETRPGYVVAGKSVDEAISSCLTPINGDIWYRGNLVGRQARICLDWSRPT